MVVFVSHLVFEKIEENWDLNMRIWLYMLKANLYNFLGGKKGSPDYLAHFDLKPRIAVQKC